jgi:hypothetical protein
MIKLRNLEIRFVQQIGFLGMREKVATSYKLRQVARYLPRRQTAE